METLYHLTDDGPKVCQASVQHCPYNETGHFSNLEQAWNESEKQHRNILFQPLKKSKAKTLVNETPLDEFSIEHHYGEKAPLDIQTEALNGVADALENNDQTQLVAACGTGKTYMGRQIMNHQMIQEDSTGVAVVLTSSIKLAQDTAAGMRPRDGDENSYDHTFGKFGDDYEVIEVHSKARMIGERQSILDDGVVSVDRIRQQMNDAISQNKKVIIVSTYDSCASVQKAQESSENPEKLRADILMHDEAHNILGQQTPTSFSDQVDNTAYTGFHDDIPGAIKARKRLYATATPVIREGVEDRESTETLENAIEVAELMQKDNKARMTFYSTDTEIVGGVGGYISQHDAIAAGRLAKPDYQIRDTTIHDPGNVKTPVVQPDGEVIELENYSESQQPMTIQTYSAVNSTLNAMIMDHSSEQNPVHNALAYCGSIDQAEAFKDNFRSVALNESKGMSLEEANLHADSTDTNLKRRARMRLLAEHAEVAAAHSRTDSESVAQKNAAFKMFKGHSLSRDEALKGWSPKKKVLANVDIFSEGVSITEIDTVVISDDEKCSERAMTQAIGRSIRAVPGNDYKNTGHVIIPRTVNQHGDELNKSSVAISAYGSTRVERGVSISKLRKEGVKPDHSTRFTQYSSSGESRGTILAKDLGKTHRDLDDIVAANEMNRVHRNLSKQVEGYRDMSQNEQYQLMKSTLHEESKTKRPNARKSGKVFEHLQNINHHEARSLRRSNRVLNSAIAAGDVSAFTNTVSSGFIKSGVLHSPKQTMDSGPSMDEKRKILAKHSLTLAGVVSTRPKEMSVQHKRARERFLGDSIKHIDVVKTVTAESRGKRTPDSERFTQRFHEQLSNDEFVEDAYSMIASSESRSSIPLLRSTKKDSVLKNDVDELDSQVHSKVTRSAHNGDHEYTFNPKKVTKSGNLRSDTVNELAKIAWD